MGAEAAPRPLRLALLLAAACYATEPRAGGAARPHVARRGDASGGAGWVLRLRGAGLVFRETLDFSAFYAAYPNASIYACAACGAHVSASAYVVSRKIQGM